MAYYIYDDWSNKTMVFINFLGNILLPLFLFLFLQKKDKAEWKSKFLLLLFLIFVDIFLYSLFSNLNLNGAGGFATILLRLTKNIRYKYIAVAFAVNLALYYGYVKKWYSIKYHKATVPFYQVFIICLAFGIIIFMRAFVGIFGNNMFSAIMFHLENAANQIDYVMVKQFCIKPLMDIALISFTAFVLCCFIEIKIKLNDKIKTLLVKTSKPLAFMFLFISVLFLGLNSGIIAYWQSANLPYSNFYEDNYIKPKEVIYEFPSKKRNLIVVFVESLETGFLTVEDGGGFYENLIPEVKQMMEDNISFSNTGGLGGAEQVSGAGWTIAGITAQFCGVPLTVGIDGNSIGNVITKFLPGAYGIGDILYDNGYKNYWFCGSDKEFSGKGKFLATHGNTKVYDYKYFLENNYIPKTYSVNWGIEDRKVYAFAKQIISKQISTSDAPFFIGIETADTHPMDGYLDEIAERQFDTQYKNVLRDMSKQLYDFILWLKEQSFYENTTVIILGDHLFMDATRFSVLPKERRIINIFINSALITQHSKTRLFTSFDIFPALVDSIGMKYPAKGLALGRSMNNGEKTLLEVIGNISTFDKDLQMKSKLYDSFWRSE